MKTKRHRPKKSIHYYKSLGSRRVSLRRFRTPVVVVKRRSPIVTPGELSGKWVAWSRRAIIAVGDSPEAVQEAAHRLGHRKPSFAYIPTEKEARTMGGI